MGALHYLVHTQIEDLQNWNSRYIHHKSITQQNHAVQKQMRSSQNRDSSSLFCEVLIQIRNKTGNSKIL